MKKTLIRSGPTDRIVAEHWGNLRHRSEATTAPGDLLGAMAAKETHEHQCRDCGMGYECFGTDNWNGCNAFTGSCGQCELDEMTP
jgi:hypothetical protein